MTDAAFVARWRLDLEDYVGVVEVAPTGRHAVAGSLGGDAALIDIDDGSSQPLARHEMGVLSAAWSTDGTRVAVGGQDGSVHIYDPDGRQCGSVSLSSWVTTMAWSPQAPVLAIGAGRSLVIVDQDGLVLHDFDDQPSTVTAVAWSPDGTRVGAAAYGGIGWHDVIGERAGRRRRFDWRGSLLALALSPDGKWACAGAQDSTVHLWKLWSGRELSMAGYPSKITHLAFRTDSRWLAVACLGEVTVWDFSGSGPAGTMPAASSGHDESIEALAWSPSGDSVATGGADGRTIVWAAPTRPGQDLTPVAALESDASTSRLGWVGTGDLVIGRADGGVVKLAR